MDSVDTLEIGIKVNPHNLDCITADVIGDVMCISGKSFSFERVGDVSCYRFIGDMKGRRVIRENIKSIRDLMNNG